MKKFLSLAFVAGILAATAACSADGDKGVYSNDGAAPYASDRTAGANSGAVSSADTVFEDRLVK